MKINESIALADQLNAKYIILHASHGSMQHAADLLREVSDSRLLIEIVQKVGLGVDYKVCVKGFIGLKPRVGGHWMEIWRIYIF